MRLKRFMWVFVLVVAATLGTWFATRQHRESLPKKAPAVEHLTIAMDIWSGYYPLVLADELGFLAKRNVSVTVVFPEDTHRMIADFAARRYDGICVSLGDIVLTTRIDPEVRMVLCSDISAGADQILGDPALFEPSTIRGRKISTTLGGFGELFVRRYLKSLNLPEDVLGSIAVVNGDAAQAPELLTNKAVDGCHTWEPYASEATRRGYKKLYSSDQTPGLISDGLIVHSSLLKASRTTGTSLVDAWFEAVDWWKQNPAEGNARILKRLKEIKGPQDPISLDGILLQTRADNLRLFLPGSKPSLHDTVKDYVNFFLAKGTLGAHLGPTELLDPSLLLPAQSEPNSSK